MSNDVVSSCPCGHPGSVALVKHRNSRKHTDYELTKLCGPIVQCPCGGKYRSDDQLSHTYSKKHRKYDAGPPVQCRCGVTYLENLEREHIETIKHKRYLDGDSTARQLWANKIVVCECGGHFTQGNRAKHEKSAKHTKFAGTNAVSELILDVPSLTSTRS